MGCQLAEELSSSGFGLRAAPSEHCVDVLSDGFAFRLFLSSERCVLSLVLRLLPRSVVPLCSCVLLWRRRYSLHIGHMHITASVISTCCMAGTRRWRRG